MFNFLKYKNKISFMKYKSNLYSINNNVKNERKLTVNVNLDIDTTFNKKPKILQVENKSWHKNLLSSSILKNNNNNNSNNNININNNNNNNGLFGLRELMSYKDFIKLQNKAEKAVKHLMEEAMNDDYTKNNEKKRKLVEIFDDISNELCRVADLAEFVRTTHPSSYYRMAADTTFSNISQLVEKLNTNRKLYSRLKLSYENAINNDNNNNNNNSNIESPFYLNECDKRVTKLYLVDFEQSGIHLDEKTRSKFVQVNDELINVLTKFQINSQVPSTIKHSELPNKFSNLFINQEDPINIGTMYINSNNELVREFVYCSYLQNNPLQEQYFLSILSRRKKLSNLCGFDTFAHRANVGMIMETPENVDKFLIECADCVREKAENDFEKMRQFKRDTLMSKQPLMQWDLPYIVNQIKSETLGLNKNEFMDYFSLGSCMNGINLILNRLYNVNLEIVEPVPGELWHSDIYKLAVKDAKNGILGYIYCDFYQRQDKFTNVDCHFTIQCCKKMNDNSYQLPIVVLHLNFQPPNDNIPTLLTFEMMENLFHEFGHAIHSMFARTKYQHVAGTRCSTDFAEVPSQLMEHFCRDPRILKLFAKHYSTGDSLDDDIINRLCQSKKLFSSCDMQLQVVHSMLDLQFHLIDFESIKSKPIDIVEKYTNDYYSLPFIPNTHWHQRFSHIVGYGSKYYCYLVSKAIAAKIWNEVFQNDPLNSTAGENYRSKVLAYGGERPPLELIKSLIGIDIKTTSLVESLVQNL